MHDAAVDGLARDRDVSRAGGVRCRRHLERRLSARPEPLPGGQGHVRRGAGRQARRNDRDRGGVPRRVPRSRQLPQRARRLAVSRRMLEEIGARPQTIADQWQIQIQAKIQQYARVLVHTSYLSDAELAAAHSSRCRHLRGGAGRAHGGRTGRDGVRAALGAARRALPWLRAGAHATGPVSADPTRGRARAARPLAPRPRTCHPRGAPAAMPSPRG